MKKHFTMHWFILIIPVFLLACNPETNQQKARTPCFEIIPESQGYNPILIDKCSGGTWMLVQYTLEQNNDKTRSDIFTYRWQKLFIDSDEFQASYKK